jgi:mono-ADP-ribosyltransferase sirtuin 6
LSTTLAHLPRRLRAEEHAQEADLAICLGTSLQIVPACNLPLKATRVYKGGTKQKPGRLVIVNLQQTQHDRKAAKSGGLVCHARCDDVMRLLARKLRLAVPPYVRRDAVLVGHQQHAASAAADPQDQGRAAVDGSLPSGEGGSISGCDGRGGPGSAVPFTLYVQSSHGANCPMPMVRAVDISFEVGPPGVHSMQLQGCSSRCAKAGPHPDSRPAPCPPPPPHSSPSFSIQEATLKPASLQAPPFKVRRTAPRPSLIHARITLHLHEAADEGRRTVQLGYTAHLRVGQPVRECRGEERHEFVTQVVHYDGLEGDDGPNSSHPAAAQGAPALAAGAAQAASTGDATMQPVLKVKKQRLS